MSFNVQEFCVFTRKTISRIEKNPNVFGVLYFHNEYPELCTLPEIMAKTLITKLPDFTTAICHAVTDIDVTDKPIAYRIETKHNEIAVVMDNEFTACVVHKSMCKNQSNETNEE
ncbi:unnamed protein product, partial [Iphiclides podalirius]